MPQLPPGGFALRVEATIGIVAPGGVAELVGPHVVVDKADVNATGLVKR